MGKRLFMTVLVVVLGVVSGIAIVGKQARESGINDLLRNDKVLLESQGRIEKAFVDIVKGKVGDLPQGLEPRLVALEKQVADLQGTVKELLKRPAQAAPARQAPPPEDFTTVYEIPVAHTTVIGKKNAPVTIVEFIDFQCPFCARFHSPLNEVLAAYPDKVNILVKNFPLSFHPQAKPAAKAALAAAIQGKYWEMVNALLDNGRALSEEKFKEIAGTIGLDVDKFLKDYKEKDALWEEQINKDVELGAKVGVRGTPSFYINGRKTNARDFNSYKEEIDKILSK